MSPREHGLGMPGSLCPEKMLAKGAQAGACPWPGSPQRVSHSWKMMGQHTARVRKCCVLEAVTEHSGPSLVLPRPWHLRALAPSRSHMLRSHYP